MAKARKDLRGRALKKGEIQRKSDQRYMYTYTDPLGRRKFIYANDLTELREKEQKLQRDQLDGLDLYAAGKATVNDTFDRYMATKFELRDSTRNGYLYTYDHLIRDEFGFKKLVDVKYSDVLQFYYYLLNEKGIALGTLDSVHCLLHPTFQLAVRDDIIRKNPTDGVMKEISKKGGKSRGIRHALTVEEQRAFMEREAQKETGENIQVLDGMSGFVFTNRFGNIPNPQTVNDTIRRIRNSYNAEEVLKAKKEKREKLLLPHFSCHHLRHTFATRLCETETNLKVIQSIMGHRNIETTMDIYAEATERKKQESFEILAAKLDSIF